MFARFARSLQHTALHTLAALLGAGVVTFGYGAAVVWLETGVAPTAAAWWLITPLAGLATLAIAALMAVWRLAPVIFSVRVLEHLARLGDEAERKQAEQAQDEPERAPVVIAGRSSAPALPSARRAA